MSKIYPSGIRPPKDHKLEVKEVRKGLYAFQNSYEGDYEYFDRRNGSSKGDAASQSHSDQRTASGKK